MAKPAPETRAAVVTPVADVESTQNAEAEAAHSVAAWPIARHTQNTIGLVDGVCEVSRQGRTDNPCTLGVASGDPEPTSVVLWTRRTSKPRGQIPAQPGLVVWLLWTGVDRLGSVH